jgi:hypothetical protein
MVTSERIKTDVGIVERLRAEGMRINIDLAF